MIKRSLTYLTLALALLTFCRVPFSPAESGQLSEYQVKAAYLYNFAKFVEWPASSFPGNSAPFVICVLGKSPFGEALDALAARTVRSRKVQVRQVARVEEVGACQILFIGGSEKAHLKQILGALPPSGVLTVSDIRRFSGIGGMIGFVMLDDRVHFEVNLARAERAGLKVSSQMLKLATSIVE